jgi:hypothetical protein
MPDWRRRIRELLAGGDLNPTAELDVIEELAQHVEDRYQALAAQGVPEPDALALSLREIEGQSLLADLRASLPRP